MLKVIFSFKPLIKFDDGELYSLGQAICTLVADVCSTEKVKLNSDDVDWLPNELHPEAIAAGVGIEIETIGYDHRKRKLFDRQYLLELRKKITLLPGFPNVDPDAPLIWVKFVDQDGLHV